MTDELDINLDSSEKNDVSLNLNLNEQSKSDDSNFPEHIPLIPIDTQRQQEKDDARKLAKKLKKQGKIQPIIITKTRGVKKVSELNFTEQEDEILRCAMNPIYFIETYLTIFDQTQGVSGTIVPFKLFDFQKDLIKSYQNHRFVVANKYRQAGVSTTTCAYIAWYIMFNRNRQVAIVADKLETATGELMSDVVDFIDSCPAWLRPKTGRNTEKNLKDTQKLKIYDNDSKLGAFASKSLRGYTPTLLFWDETAWAEKGNEFWTAALPSLVTGGRAIMVSTPSGLDAVFYKTFDGARKNENNFHAVELWWYNDPRYNKDLVWLKNKGKKNEITLEDNGRSHEQRKQLVEDGWEASNAWFDIQVRNANGDMRKVAQELLCVYGNASLTIRNKKTGEIGKISIENLYKKLKEQNNSSEYLYKSKFMNKIKLLNKILSINIEKYRIKGGLSMFNKDFPNLINVVNEYTKDMQICSMNKTLYAKLLFLKKYYCNINNITINDKIMVFDRTIGDFIEKSDNSAKKYWDNINQTIKNTNKFYTKEETIELLKNDYKNYLGKSGNRKLISKDINLYCSVYHHTKHMDNLNKNLNKFSYRLLILINNVNIYCEKHNKLKHWKFNADNELVIGCAQCEPKYPSKNWFKLKFGDDWRKHYEFRKNKVKLNKTNSLEWHINKYGDVGIEKYEKYVLKKMKTLTKLKANRYSKISQELFWELYDSIPDKEDTYFHNLNHEYVIRIPKKYNHENIIMMIDFKHKNKIIEYNGNYWHNKEKNNIRYSILRKMGYQILIITSDDYNRNKKPKEIINKCLKFLTC
jgi:hypothetical protein